MSDTQKIKNNDLESYFYNLPDKELVIVEFLRELVFECIPHCEEKLVNNILHYYGNKRICYIWPASVSASRIDEGVVLGFCDGSRLDDQLNFLDKRSSEQFYTRTFLTFTQALHDKDRIKIFLFDASKADSLV